MPFLVLLAYALFVLDAGVWCKADSPDPEGVCNWGYWVARLPWWPFGRTQPLGWFPSWLVRDLGFRVVHPTFWIRLGWAGVVVVGSILVALGAPAGGSRRRRLPSLVLFTAFGIFVVPELIGPLFSDHPDRLVGLALPWPLSFRAVPRGVTWPWVACMVGVSGLLLPLYALRHGRRFCSTFCPYGALAETLGTPFDGATARGPRATAMRNAAVATLVLAGLLAGANAAGALDPRIEHAYRLAVLLGGMGVVGLGFAPVLGPRSWCRWLCPLGAAMDLLARRFPRVAIHRTAGASCEGCSACSTACTMGLDVAAVVQTGVDVTNRHGPCIQCGLCVDACPTDALTLVQLPSREASA